MNKNMYIGILLGVIVSVIINNIYDFPSKEMVSVGCAVIGAFLGASCDNNKKH
ncbi:hypothetical protein HV819_08705 [Anaerococcus sp. AGMB00486]|uniref:Glycine zipper family protein n=1 Tax=Anaerococcus faecalis TaxID=2742993 RepID=A0ABX2NBP9_9FIRM|nr:MULTISPECIES: hypothetical protein [Anaerococcus]MDY3005597.1 hypothetical protein [Anaerococcus porci]NVF12055.1 hypothetical protein [Anaerococcus faecalis]